MSVKNFNISYTIITARGMAFIIGMCVPYDKFFFDGSINFKQMSFIPSQHAYVGPM